MYKVYCANLDVDRSFSFFSGSLEDCVLVALNLHRGSNLPHKICVFDADFTEVLSFSSKDNG